MQSKTIVGFVSIMLFFTYNAFADSAEVELEPIVVTSGYQAADITPANDFHTAKIQYWQHTDTSLDSNASIDISRRSILDTQSDITIRGSTPEQTTVAVNGIPLNNPQTAHHNLDLGLPSIFIDSSVISGGPSPSSWGQGAMGGAVNFKTKKPDKNETQAMFSGGTDATQRGSLYLSRCKGRYGLNIAAEEASSDGWRYDTDFRNLSLASSATADITDVLSGDILAAYGEKEFGASQFYGPYDSKEWTNTMLIAPSVVLKKERFSISPKAYYKKHHDKFMLDIKRPDFYINHHTTDIEGLGLDASYETGRFGSLALSGDINEDRIKSTRLGKHRRRQNSASATWANYSLLFFGYDLSLRVDDYSDYGTKILPQAGIFFQLNESIRLRSSAAKSARIPTYTELYYDSPASKGNKGLTTEKANNYDAGIDITIGKKNEARLSCTVFRRDSSNLIDWVKETPAQVFYQARNITTVNTEGFETNIAFKLFDWLNLDSGYCYIDSDIEKDSSIISKYTLSHPNHKVISQAQIILPKLIQAITLVYKNRKDYSHYFIMGYNTEYEAFKGGYIFVAIDNIFNSPREDIKDNGLPGREIEAGVRVKF